MAKKYSNSDNSSDPSSEGLDLSLPEHKIKYLEGQTQSFQIQLAHRSELVANASSRFESMRISLAEMTERYEKEKQATIDMTRDMTRQYKGMQDDLLNKINAKEKTIQELTDSLNINEKENKRILEAKDVILKGKEDYIRCMKDKMEELCGNFAGMLTDSLEQMKIRIEVQSANYNETSIPIQQRMEELNLQTTTVS